MSKNNVFLYFILAVLLLAALLFGITLMHDGGVILREPQRRASPDPNVPYAVWDFAEENNIPLSAWPQELLELLEKNPETEEFVLNYPLKKDSVFTGDLDAYTSTVPLLLQWDMRWGYKSYSGEMMALSGCGPTALSMVCLYLLHDPTMTPAYIADFAQQNGYSEVGNGSAWTLISQGGPQLGLDVTELPLDEGMIISNLEAGNPIICVMGPGAFTSTGHFIVLTGYCEGKIKVNDPNSRIRSEQLWEYSEIEDQFRNLWVCK